MHQLAGQPAPKEVLVNVEALIRDYYDLRPDVSCPAQSVSFGTSGHRGCSTNSSFNEDHILAITQSICDYRVAHNISGPLFLGKDTHALSGVAQKSALEVLAANDVHTIVQSTLDGKYDYTPTPVVSHAILCYNRNHPEKLADGIVITPSHNPPEDGGFKYNPPHGGPADTEVTAWIQARANQLLESRNSRVKRLTLEKALRSERIFTQDYSLNYIEDLANVLDLEAIANSNLRLGVDPLGGASLHYWNLIAERYKLNLTVTNEQIDPQFSFMFLDHDGKIRMDCSSPWAMTGLLKLRNSFDIAFAADPDSDRHGIVTPLGLMNPNHYLAVSVNYLFQNRDRWPSTLKIGKTLVSSALIDRVCRSIDRSVVEVPVGFKWFVDGLLHCSLGFGGEESAGASFLRTDATPWSTDKDGIILGLLAAEITAVTGKNPGLHYQDLTDKFGKSYYKRIDMPASIEQKQRLKKLVPDDIEDETFAGEKILQKISKAPGNGQAIGGLKVVTENGWFAARPSGTENINKIYAESLESDQHLARIIHESQELVQKVLL